MKIAIIGGGEGGGGAAAYAGALGAAIAVKRFSVLIEPILICITGVIVGFVYIAFFMAIFALAGSA